MKSQQMKLTDSVVLGLPFAQEDKRQYIHDLGLTGLVLQVTKFKKSWYVYKSFRQKPLKFKLGDFPVLSAEKARSAAIKVMADMANDIHPQEARRLEKSEVRTVGELFERYLEDHLKPHTRRWGEAERSFRRHCEHNDKCGQGRKCEHLATIELAHLRRIDLQAWVNKVGGEVGKQTADRTFNTIRACLRWGIEQELCAFASPPWQFVRLFKVKPSVIILEKKDWTAIKEILKDEEEHIRDIIYMLLYTAARKTNVLQMKWEDIHLAARIWNVPAEESKNGKELLIRLTDEALEILQRRIFKTRHTGWVFPSPVNDKSFKNIDKPWRRIRDEALYKEEKKISKGKMKKVTIHGLKHTTCTWLHRTGANAFTIQDAAQHSSVTTTRIYTHGDSDTIRKALERAHSELNRNDEQTA